MSGGGGQFAYLYSEIYGEQPLASKGRAAINAAKKIAAALPVIQAFAEEVAAGGVAFLDELLSGDPARLANCSQLAQDIGEIAGDVLADVLESLTGIDAETRGRIIGFVLYGIAEAMATAGVGAALKADAACNAARALSKSELLKGYPKVVASLQKSIELITTVLKVNICFVAGTPVHTPRGLAPIETIGIGDLVWTRPEHGADRAKVIRRVTEVAVTNPIEIFALELATPVGIETLRCTPGHPFFEIGRETFVAAENLAEGDRLSLAGDGAATVVSITAEQPVPGECFTTYNFAVEDCHTYFVGQAAVWAHNAGGQVCSELSSVYRKALRKSAKPEEAAEAVVDHLAKMLAKPNANAKAIEKELAHAKIPGLSPKELLERARARVANNKPLKYKLGPHDVDWRGKGRTLEDALNDAFFKTGVPRNEFEVTKWGKDKHGKTHPVEWRHKSGAEVNIDWPHASNGPDAPHVGWQTGGKRGIGGARRGHTLIDDVPYNR